MALRRQIRTVHRWTGLTLGLVVVVVTLTGAGLVFRPVREPVVPACTRPLPLDQLAAAALAAHPGGKIDSVHILGADRARMVRLADGDTFYLDPCSGAVVLRQTWWGGVFGRIEQIHRFKFIDGGDQIAGLSAASFLVILIGGGLFLWWPRSKRAFKRALTFDSRLPGNARTLNRHQVVGVYASLVLLISAATGLPQAFEGIQTGIDSLTGSPPRPRPKNAPPKSAAMMAAPASLESLWRQAQALVPAPAETMMRLPRKPADSVEVWMIDGQAPNPNARTYLYLDARSAAVLRFTPYADSGLGDRLCSWTLSLHTGQVGGVFGQAILLFGAGAALFLAYSGIRTALRPKVK